MTRFCITLPEGVQMVQDALEQMRGGEIFVPKIPSLRVIDLAKVLAPEARIRVVGIRPGEKLHEEMISVSDARRTLDMGTHFVIKPETDWWAQRDDLQGHAVPEGFSYSSELNKQWLSLSELTAMVGDLV